MYSILIIEDDPSYLSMMKVILEMEKFEVHLATNGQSALALLNKHRPDLILCDIMMPDMDGHMVLESIKKEESLADIPFIFVTAMGKHFDIRKGMLEGADDYLPKPFTADELIAAVNVRIQRNQHILKQHDKSAFYEEENEFRNRKITKRENNVLLMVGEGFTSKKIAEQLGISLKTVEMHRSNLMRKLDATNSARLAYWSIIAARMTA